MKVGTVCMKILLISLALILSIGFLSLFSHVAAMTSIERAAWFDNHPVLEAVGLLSWPIFIFGGMAAVWLFGKKT